MKLQAVIAGSAPGPQTRTVVLLHGYGADENDLVPLIPELGLDLAAVSLRAPLSLGGRMRAWYHLDQTATGFRYDVGEIAAADALVAEAVAELAAERGKLILLGFSQGAGMASRAALFTPQHVRGLVSLSGVPPERVPAQRASPELLRGLPAFVAHGEQDPLLPLSDGYETRATLEEAGMRVAWHQYSMGHTIAMEEVEDLRHWLGAL